MKNKFFKKALSVFTAMVMALSLMTGIPFSELGLGITVSAADAVTVGEFEVTGGTLGTDYTFTDGVLTINTETALTIKNADPSTPTTDRIEVADTVSANITLAGVNISANGQPFHIADNSTGDVTITLAEGTENVLFANVIDCAGLAKGGGADSGTLTINGTGKLTATGNWNAAGIGGGGAELNTANIIIESGTIIANGGGTGAGIGSGNKGTATNITIKGGTVTATGGNRSANTVDYGRINIGGSGIGAATNGDASNIVIQGGSVLAKVLNNRAMPIGKGCVFNPRASQEEINSTAVTPTNGTDPVYLLTIANPDRKTVYIDGVEYTPINHTAADSADTNLYVYLTGETHTVKVGTVTTTYCFDSINNCYVDTGSDFVITADDGTDLVYSADYTYPASTGVLTILSDKAVTIKNANNGSTTDRIEVASGVSANITLAGVDIDVLGTNYVAAFKIADDSTGNVTITLADGTTNTLKSGKYCAGLQKNGDTSTGTLTIAGTGSLSATGDSYGAGIGGGDYGKSSNITISDGKITAQGGYHGAGIGGGSEGVVGSNITISGGTVTAEGGDGGAGIGGGYRGNCIDIKISGGSVKAVAGEEYEHNDGTVYSPAAIGQGIQYNIITGVYSNSAEVTPTDGNGNNVYLLEIANAEGADIKINGNDYPDKHFDETKIYAYLPAMTAEVPNVIEVGDDTIKCYYDTTNSKWLTVVDAPEADTTVFTYDGAEKIYALTESDYYTISDNTTQTNAGTYTVTVALKENCVWSDGTTDDKEYTFTIAKATLDTPINDIEMDFYWDETDQQTATASGLPVGMGTENATIDVTDVNGIINANSVVYGQGRVRFTLNGFDTEKSGISATIKVTLSSQNYNDFSFNVIVNIVTKNVQTITADDVILTYGDTNGKINATTNGDGAISYEVATGTDVISVDTDGNITINKTGTATVTVKATETADCSAAAKTVTVTVNKAVATVTAKSYTITVGETLPTYAYDVAGLVNGETLPIDVTISCTANGKTAGTYDIVVSGDAENDNYKFTYVNGTLKINAAYAPQNVKSTAGDSKITISWSAVSGATKYRVQRLNGTSWSTISYPTATSYTDTNVTEGNTYKYRVLAYVGGAWGKISSVAEVTAYSTIPRELKAVAGEGSVKLSWKDVDNATKYRVQRQNGTTWSTVNYSNTTSYIDSKLTVGKEYKYRVLAYVNGAWGKLSETASAVPVPYTSVQQLKATESVSRIILSWESLEGATKYRVQRLNGTAWATISYPTATTYTDKDVVNGTAYKYRVLAYIDGSWRKASEPITATPLKAPENIKATAVDGGIEISWDEVVGATKYRIQRGNGTIWCTIVYTPETSYIDTDVRDGTAYSYRVLVYIDGAWSLVSLPVTATA